MTDYSISNARIQKYIELTAKALDKVSIIDKSGTDNHSKAEDILVMVKAYHSDAKFF